MVFIVFALCGYEPPSIEKQGSGSSSLSTGSQKERTKSRKKGPAKTKSGKTVNPLVPVFSINDIEECVEGAEFNDEKPLLVSQMSRRNLWSVWQLLLPLHFRRMVVFLCLLCQKHILRKQLMLSAMNTRTKQSGEVSACRLDGSMVLLQKILLQDSKCMPMAEVSLNGSHMLTLPSTGHCYSSSHVLHIACCLLANKSIILQESPMPSTVVINHGVSSLVSFFFTFKAIHLYTFLKAPTGQQNGHRPVCHICRPYGCSIWKTLLFIQVYRHMFECRSKLESIILFHKITS